MPLKIKGKLVWGFYLLAFSVMVSRIAELIVIVIEPDQLYYYYTPTG